MAYPRTYTAFRRTIEPLPSTIKQTQESLPNELGPHDVVIKIHPVSLNYREHATLIGTYPVKTDNGGIPCSDAADMDAEVKSLTDGRGVDFVINNTGPQSIMEDVGFLCARRGTVSLVGFLYGFDADWEAKRLMELMVKGIAAGSKADLELNRFIEEKDVKLKLALHRVFEFKDSKAAFEYLGSGKHTGKIVIKVAE